MPCRKALNSKVMTSTEISQRLALLRKRSTKRHVSNGSFQPGLTKECHNLVHLRATLAAIPKTSSPRDLMNDDDRSLLENSTLFIGALNGGKPGNHRSHLDGVFWSLSIGSPCAMG